MATQPQPASRISKVDAKVYLGAYSRPNNAPVAKPRAVSSSDELAPGISHATASYLICSIL